MAKESKLTKWLNTPLVLKTKSGNAEGTIKCGVRLPICPGMTPLTECETGSTEKIEGVKPAYWFVNDDQSVKVKLITKNINYEKGTVSGIGKDSGLFKYTIQRR